MGIQYDILFHYFYFKKKENYLYIYTNFFYTYVFKNIKSI
ncbi:hypothetical protein bthur0011_33790 [Bacillus thuringiensis serovar huazhongensis BGSC 4BD1]|nr:hypothetical protein bthur0011_33790 [Bacillus thuringiensis serovar huazhongensis BGSC 4BD1]